MSEDHTGAHGDNGKKPKQESNFQQPDASGKPKDTKPSLTSRIQSSASTLFRDAVSQPSGGHGLDADLAQSLAGTGKAGTTAAGASRAMSASMAEASRLRNREGAGSASFLSSGSTGGGQSQPTGSFRSPLSSRVRSDLAGGFQLDDLTTEQFAQQQTYPLDDYRHNRQILLSNSDLFLEGAASGSIQMEEKEEEEIQGRGKGKGKGKARDIGSDIQQPENERQQHDAITKIYASMHPSRDPSDGAAVVSLLSDPSFQPGYLFQENDPDRDTNYSLTTELIADSQEDAILPLTPAEIRIIDSFRRHPSFIDPTLTMEKQRIKSTSLVPDIDAFLAQGEGHAARMPTPELSIDGAPGGSKESNTNFRDFILASLPDSVTAEWLRVEERYQDEVWGYLRPDLEAVTRELEEKNQDQDPNKREGGEGQAEGPAVRRLRMILKHMQR